MHEDKEVCFKEEECSIDLSVIEIKYQNNCIVLVNSGSPHLIPVELNFYEAKTCFEQGKIDGNSGVKCHLHHQSGLGPPASSFMSHSQAVPRVYVQLRSSLEPPASGSTSHFVAVPRFNVQHQ